MVVVFWLLHFILFAVSSLAHDLLSFQSPLTRLLSISFQVVTLDMGLLVAGTKYRGEFEERLKKLMDEIKQADDIILFIDEVRDRGMLRDSRRVEYGSYHVMSTLGG